MTTQSNTISSINTAVAAYVASYKAGRKAIDSMLAALKGSALPFERKALAGPLMQSVADAYGIKLVAKDRGTGVTWDLENANVKVAREHNAAKQCHKEMLGKLFGGTSVAQQPEVTLTRAQMHLIRQCHAAGITMKMYGQGVAKLA